MTTSAKAAHEPLAKLYYTALLDLDGVVYRGADAVPHAVGSLKQAALTGMHLAYVTNNASRTPAAVAHHLREIGLPAHEGDIITAAQAVARMIAERMHPGAKVLPVGGEGLRVALSAYNLELVESAEDRPDAVVQGFRPDTTWADLAEVAYAVEAGAAWFAANTDLTMPTARGIAPGNGALVAAVAAACGGKPMIAGKPEPALHRETMLRTGAVRPLVVGDRLDTDIEGANRAGADSLLVLTGVTDLARLKAAPPEQHPTYVAEDLRGLNDPDQLIAWR